MWLQKTSERIAILRRRLAGTKDQSERRLIESEIKGLKYAVDMFYAGQER